MDEHPKRDPPVAPLPSALTNHVFAHVGHGVELLFADLTGELLLGVAVDDLVVLMEGPELLEPLPARHTLQGERGWVGKQRNVPRYHQHFRFTRLSASSIEREHHSKTYSFQKS